MDARAAAREEIAAAQRHLEPPPAPVSSTDGKSRRSIFGNWPRLWRRSLVHGVRAREHIDGHLADSLSLEQRQQVFARCFTHTRHSRLFTVSALDSWALTNSHLLGECGEYGGEAGSRAQARDGADHHPLGDAHMRAMDALWLFLHAEGAKTVPPEAAVAAAELPWQEAIRFDVKTRYLLGKLWSIVSAPPATTGPLPPPGTVLPPWADADGVAASAAAAAAAAAGSVNGDGESLGTYSLDSASIEATRRAHPHLHQRVAMGSLASGSIGAAAAVRDRVMHLEQYGALNMHAYSCIFGVSALTGSSKRDSTQRARDEWPADQGPDGERITYFRFCLLMWQLADVWSPAAEPRESVRFLTALLIALIHLHSESKDGVQGGVSKKTLGAVAGAALKTADASFEATTAPPSVETASTEKDAGSAELLPGRLLVPEGGDRAHFTRLLPRTTLTANSSAVAAHQIAAARERMMLKQPAARMAARHTAEEEDDELDDEMPSPPPPTPMTLHTGGFQSMEHRVSLSGQARSRVGALADTPDDAGAGDARAQARQAMRQEGAERQAASGSPRKLIKKALSHSELRLMTPEDDETLTTVADLAPAPSPVRSRGYAGPARATERGTAGARPIRSTKFLRGAPSRASALGRTASASALGRGVGFERHHIDAPGRLIAKATSEAALLLETRPTNIGRQRTNTMRSLVAGVHDPKDLAKILRRRPSLFQGVRGSS